MKSLKVVKFLLLAAIVAAALPSFATAQSTITVNYTNAADNSGGSGVKNARLIVKKNNGAWTTTSLTNTNVNGSFSYTTTGDATYSFKVQVEDLAGNKSDLNSSTSASYLLDTTAPIAAKTTAPISSTSLAFALSFSGASDTGSGISRVELWAKKEGESWQYTGQQSQSSATSGTFIYSAATTGRYYFATRVYDKSGNASATPKNNGTSNTLVKAPATTPTTPLDSDNDGISDEQENLDGTNPYDRGSVIDVLGTTVCTEWNGFLDGMWNILELSNTSTQKLNAVTSLYDITGKKISSTSFSVAAGQQYDVLVHNMEGRSADSYGKVCTTHNGQAGNLNGRMVYYKADNSNAALATGFQFAFAMPLSNGKLGDQFLSFNTYQPSMTPADQNNMVANWIQVTNLSSKQQKGSLTFYSQSGAVLGDIPVTLAPEQRADFAGHQFGSSLVGQVAWRPVSQTTRFSVRNVRYLYDNPTGENSFDTAFQLAGLQGSGELLSVPVDTRNQTSVLELLNTTASSIASTVKIYDEAGSLVYQTVISLEKFQSIHVIVDTLLGAGKRGIATIKSNKQNSLVAIAMQYGRDSSAGIQYMYGLPAVPALGSVLSGSYNTFLSQNSELVILNPKAEAQTVTLQTKSGNTSAAPVAPVTITIPAHGVIAVDLNQFDSVDSYGTLSVQSDSENSLVAWTLRARGTDYVMPAPVVQ